MINNEEVVSPCNMVISCRIVVDSDVCPFFGIISFQKFKELKKFKWNMTEKIDDFVTLNFDF